MPAVLRGKEARCRGTEWGQSCLRPLCAGRRTEVKQVTRVTPTAEGSSEEPGSLPGGQWADLCICCPLWVAPVCSGCTLKLIQHTHHSSPVRSPPRAQGEGARALVWSPPRSWPLPHLEQLEHGDGLQDALVVLQQAALGHAGPGHDVVQHGLHHALAHWRVQVAVHDAPRAAEEADALTVPAG